ncbi:hypothetical protein, partial [Streptomyces sp. NPDC059003]|uniref:hypothetical protein n=1 Tax=Streptomyces sp. NPDC059003 TaxID=3346691 RepID=UPI0036AFBDF8
MLHSTVVANWSSAPVFDVQVLLYGRTANGPRQEITHFRRRSPLGPLGQEWRIEWRERWAGWELPLLLPEPDGGYAAELVLRWAAQPCGPLWQVTAGSSRVVRAPGHEGWRRAGHRLRFWR